MLLNSFYLYSTLLDLHVLLCTCALFPLLCRQHGHGFCFFSPGSQCPCCPTSYLPVQNKSAPSLALRSQGLTLANLSSTPCRAAGTLHTGESRWGLGWHFDRHPNSRGASSLIGIHLFKRKKKSTRDSQLTPHHLYSQISIESPNMHYNNGIFFAVLELAGITEMMYSVQRDYDACVQNI